MKKSGQVILLLKILRFSTPQKVKFRFFYLGRWGLKLTSFLLLLWTELLHFPFHSLCSSHTGLLASLGKKSSTCLPHSFWACSLPYPRLPDLLPHCLLLCHTVREVFLTTAYDLAPSHQHSVPPTILHLLYFFLSFITICLTPWYTFLFHCLLWLDWGFLGGKVTVSVVHCGIPSA